MRLVATSSSSLWSSWWPDSGSKTHPLEVYTGWERCRQGVFQMEWPPDLCWCQPLKRLGVIHWQRDCISLCRARLCWCCYHWANSTKWLKCYTGVSWLWFSYSNFIFVTQYVSLWQWDKRHSSIDWSCLSGVWIVWGEWGTTVRRQERKFFQHVIEQKQS